MADVTWLVNDKDTPGPPRPIDVGDSPVDLDDNAITLTRSFHVTGFEITDETTPGIVDASTPFPKSAFDPSAREELQVRSAIPEEADGSTVTVKIKFQMDTADAAGQVRLGLTLATNGGAFAAEVNETIDTNDAADTVETVTLATTLTLSADDDFVLKIARDVTHVDDDHTGNLELISVIFSYSAKIAG